MTLYLKRDTHRDQCVTVHALRLCIKMKEILYIQAGELSNYTGTHFWNTQESYLTLDESGDHAGIDPSVAFCENVDDKVSVRYLISSSLISLFLIGQAHIMSSLGYNRQKM